MITDLPVTAPPSLSPLARQKAALRADLKALRGRHGAARDAAQVRAAGQAAADLLAPLSLSALSRPRVAALFQPLPFEFDPAPIAALLRQRGALLAYPRVAASRPPTLCFHLLRDPARLVRSRITAGVELLEPAADEPLAPAPDVFIVPGLGFDRAGNRLGFGRGFYDVALRALPAAWRVAACYPEALRPAIPHDEDDEPMDLIVTPTELIVTAARPSHGLALATTAWGGRE